METQTLTITRDQKPELVSLFQRLPAILAGNVPDEHGIAAGFKARIGFAILSLIAPNFDELGRGNTGADGTKWRPLTAAYLAYQRRFGPGEQADLKKLAGLGKQHRHAPGYKQTGEPKKGLLDPQQLKQWRQIYARHLAYFITRLSEAEAKAIAAGIAWNKMKELGAKTKLEVYGQRQVQILVDTGRLRGSLLPGSLDETGGPEAHYRKPSGIGSQDQEFDISVSGQVIVGTNVEYAVHHHNPKNPRRKRRLWPERFPDGWWREILGAAISGLSKIQTIFRTGGV